MKSKQYQFSETLIDVTRNSTDDFNLFHDKLNWKKISNNPFGGPIALGFQLLGLISEKLKEHHKSNQELDFIKTNQLNYNNYQIKFAQVVTPKDTISIDIKKTIQNTDPEFVLSNRFSLKTESSLALIGFYKATQSPLISEAPDISGPGEVNYLPDRSFTKNNEWFIKHKFFNTSNAKNFLVGCNVEQANYFDEINDKVHFPETFPIALSSCALLERATKLGHDFEKDPMVYVSQEHSIDKELVNTLASNDKLSMIVRREEKDSKQELETFHCYGLLSENRVLYRSILTLTPLSSLMTKIKDRNKE